MLLRFRWVRWYNGIMNWINLSAFMFVSSVISYNGFKIPLHSPEEIRHTARTMPHGQVRDESVFRILPGPGEPYGAR